MPRLRAYSNRSDIIWKNKFFAKCSIEYKNETDLGMLFSDPLKGLISEPTYAFEFVFE